MTENWVRPPETGAWECGQARLPWPRPPWQALECWGALRGVRGDAAVACRLSGCSRLVLSLLPGAERRGPKGAARPREPPCSFRFPLRQAKGPACALSPPSPPHRRLLPCRPEEAGGPAPQLPPASASSPVAGTRCRVAAHGPSLRPDSAPGLRSRHPASGRAHGPSLRPDSASS